MIVVTTPTGNIGRHLLSNLAASGLPVRVVARDPSRLPHNLQGHVDVAQGSIDDPDTLRRALSGARSLFWCVPQSNAMADVDEYYLHFTRPMCAAVRACGVKRVVAVSSGGRGRAKQAGPISALHAMEEMIEGAGVDFRALRNGSFMENLLWQVEPLKRQGMFFYPLHGDVKMPTCAARDVAASAAQLLKDPAWTGQGGLAVHGPEDLSFNDMARVMTDSLGKPIRFEQIPGDAYEATLVQHGSSKAFARSMVEMFNEIADGIYGAEPRHPETTTSTSFKEWCGSVLRPSIL